MKRSASGLSVLELLISITIITTVLVTILGYYNSSIKYGLKSRARSELKYIAESEMERLLSLPYSSPTLDCYGLPVGKTDFRIDQEKFLIKTNVVFLDPDTGDIPNEIPTSREDDTHLKRLTVSAARVDGLGSQIDLINFKTP